MKINLFGIVLIAVLSVFIFTGCRSNFNNNSNNEKTTKVSLDNKQFVLEIARSEEEKTKGLSGRKSLPFDRGMLFIYDKPDYLQFWMKDTLISLQLIFLNNCQIVDIQETDIEKNPSQPQKIYKSKFPADNAIELNIGSVSKNAVGEKILELCDFQKTNG